MLYVGMARRAIVERVINFENDCNDTSLKIPMYSVSPIAFTGVLIYAEIPCDLDSS